MRRATLALGALVLVGCGGTAPAPAGPAPRRRSVDAYVAMLESPGRAEWQRPAELVAALGIEPGMRVADVGTGSGYFLPYLNEAVGPDGEVVAQDIDPDLLAVVAARVREEALDRVTILLGEADDPKLPEASFDRILMVDVLHHVADPVPFLAHLRRALRPDGRLFVVDFPPGDSVPVEVSGHDHRIARERVLALARAAGLGLVGEHQVPRYQFMLEFRCCVGACPQCNDRASRIARPPIPWESQAIHRPTPERSSRCDNVSRARPPIGDRGGGSEGQRSPRARWHVTRLAQRLPSGGRRGGGACTVRGRRIDR